MDKSEPEIEPTRFLRAGMVDRSIRGAFEEFISWTEGKYGQEHES